MSNKAKCGSDTGAVYLHELKSRECPTRWGRWRLNARTNELEFWDDLRGKVYWIDLGNARTSSAACLDWIFQVSQKTWMKPDDRSNLLLAIRDTVDPQANLCSWGIEKARARA